MYRIKKQVWLPTHIEQTRQFTPSARIAERLYLARLHESETTQVYIQNMKTGCACWPSSCAHK